MWTGETIYIDNVMLIICITLYILPITIIFAVHIIIVQLNYRNTKTTKTSVKQESQ